MKDGIAGFQKPWSLILVSLCLLGLSTSAWAADVLEQLNLKFSASFDKAVSDMSPKDALIEAHGGRIVEDGISGGALRLEKGQYLVLDAQKVIGSSPEGTLMFWVRPHWDYYQQEDDRLTSHTFLSFTWDDPSRSYFTLSDGWWEPAGSPYTYLVFSSSEYAHLHGKINYSPGRWNILAATWETSPKGALVLHRNGEVVSRWEGAPLRNMVPLKTLNLGSDGGTPLGNDRWADCDFDHVLVFSKKLSDEEMTRVIQLKDSQWEQHMMPWLAELPGLTYAPAKSDAGVALESRIIFDEGRGWMTEAGAKDTLKRINRAGFNVYIPCVWHGGGARYPTSIAVPEINVDLSGEDPLFRLISLAHAEGIEVHPWFCVGLRSREFYPEFFDAGTPANSFDFHKAAFRKFITELMLDVVRRYNVDGINLDYIRTQGLCISKSCQDDYWQITSRDLMTDLATRLPYGALEAHVQKWQDEAVEDVVRQVSTEAKKIREDLIVSVDGTLTPTVSFIPPNDQGRQEIRWANQGLVDVVFSMDYRPAPDFDVFARARREIQSGTWAVPLLGNYDGARSNGHVSRNARLVADLVSYAHCKWPEAVALYIYSLLDDAQIEALRTGPFAVPAMPVWRRAPTVGKVKGFRTMPPGNTGDGAQMSK